ncbi:MAG: hypothetical protein AABY15_06565 [Nanoarchaeota archaeon]
MLFSCKKEEPTPPPAPPPAVAATSSELFGMATGFSNSYGSVEFWKGGTWQFAQTLNVGTGVEVSFSFYVDSVYNVKFYCGAGGPAYDADIKFNSSHAITVLATYSTGTAHIVDGTTSGGLPAHYFYP